MTAHDRHDDNPIARDHHANEPSTGDLVGEGVGGASGAVTGALLGSAGGPLGTLIGGLAGAAGGWWSGRSISEAAAHYSDEDEQHYRRHFDSSDRRPEGYDYDRARTGYALGHYASRNPDYKDRKFDEVWEEMKPGFSGEHEQDYDQMRDFAQTGFERGTKVIRPSGGDDRVTIR